MVNSSGSCTSMSRTGGPWRFHLTWLDELPLEIAERIASFLYRPCFLDDRHSSALPTPLALAAVSPIQQIAVDSTHSGLLQLGTAKNVTQLAEVIRSWRDVLSNINGVALPLEYCLRFDPDVGDLLSLPTIQTAILQHCSYRLLHALHDGRSVKELEIHLQTYFVANLEATSVWETLSSCPVEELRLVCHRCGTRPGPCILEQTLASVPHQAKWMTLRSLHLKCNRTDMESFPSATAHFPNLEEFRLEHKLHQDMEVVYAQEPVQLNMSHEICQHLLRMKRVEMINCGSTESLVPTLKSRLTAFSTISLVNIGALMEFKSCPNLRFLDVTLIPGAEVYLPLRVSNLISLSLGWSQLHFPSLDIQLYAPVPAALYEIVRRNEELEELRFKNALMSSSLIEEILYWSSGRIRVLEVPIIYQDVSAGHLFSRLVNCVIRYCPHLVELKVCSVSMTPETVPDPPMFKEHVAGTCEPRGCSLCHLRDRMKCGLHVLRRRLVRLCVADSLKKVIFNV